MRALLIIATVADFALAALLIGISGFIFGGGPQSMNAGSLAAVGYVAAIVACLAAPFIGFAFNRHGKGQLGVLVAWLPPLAFVIALMVPAPY